MKGCEAMKKLICAKEVEALEKQGQKVMYIDDNTLITPSAKDAAAACGIEFSTEAPPAPTPQACNSAAAPAAAPAAPAQNGIDSELIYKALTALMERERLVTCCSRLAANSPTLRKKIRTAL